MMVDDIKERLFVWREKEKTWIIIFLLQISFERSIIFPIFNQIGWIGYYWAL